MEGIYINRNELQLATKGSFQVRDADLGRADSDFIKFLRSEGFEWKYGFWDCDWVWVNIDTKVYARGRPGVKYSDTIGGHAITIPEFMTIYRIFKKYEGLSVLDFGTQSDRLQVEA